MKLIVNPHKIEIDKNPVNEREIDITKCEFEFADEITNDYVKEAYFTFNGTSYKEIIVNNQCAIPNEVLAKKGQVEIGVVAFLVENEEEIKRYNPSPAYFNTWLGSLKDNAENSEPITPSEMEQFEQALNDGLNEVANVDIDAEQLDDGMSVTITNRYGEDKTVYAYDGEKGETGATPNIQIGTVVTGDHSEVTRTGTNENPIFNFVLEKGDKGDTGATGNGIENFEKTSTTGLVDTYTITFTNGETTTLEVTNGRGISSITKTSSLDNVDTYTITYNDNTTSTFTVTNSTVTNQQFEELKAEHEELVNTLPRVTGTGESITLDNTAQYNMNVALNPSELSQDGTPTPATPIPINVVKGNNTITVASKNMINQSVLLSSLSYNGETGYYGGTPSSAINSTTSGIFKENTIYTVKCVAYTTSTASTKEGIQFKFNYTDGTETHINLSNNSTATTKTITSTSGKTVLSFEIVYVRARDINIKDLMLYEGADTTQTFIPYQLQTYPINLGTLEYCKIGDYSDKIGLTTGKNLFNPSWLKQGYISDSTVNNTTGRTRTDAILLQAGTYKFYFNYPSSKWVKCVEYANATDTSGTFLFNTQSSNYTKTITLQTNTWVRFGIDADLTDVSANAIIQLEKGTVLSYEPYGNGAWYIKKNIGKAVLNGTEEWSSRTNNVEVKEYYCTTTASDINSDDYISQMCNYGTYSRNAYNSGTVGKFAILTNNYKFYLCVPDEFTLDTFKTNIGVTNIILYYVKVNPIGTLITDETLIAQLNNLYTYIMSCLGQTNITQTNAELPFNIDASALYDLNNLISRVATLEVEV